MSEDKIMLKKEDGSISTFTKIMIFKSKVTNKTYIIYSDNEKDIYASILNNNKLETINSETDYIEINKAISKVKNNIDYYINTLNGDVVN